MFPLFLFCLEPSSTTIWLNRKMQRVFSKITWGRLLNNFLNFLLHNKVLKGELTNSKYIARWLFLNWIDPCEQNPGQATVPALLCRQSHHKGYLLFNFNIMKFFFVWIICQWLITAWTLLDMTSIIQFVFVRSYQWKQSWHAYSCHILLFHALI